MSLNNFFKLSEQGSKTQNIQQTIMSAEENQLYKTPRKILEHVRHHILFLFNNIVYSLCYQNTSITTYECRYLHIKLSLHI